jgi:pimeloyl-ACP methyl ester carboxylesterase
MARTVWQRIRTIWITTGISLTIVFIVWCLIAYAARGDAKVAARSDTQVRVTSTNGVWSFQSTSADSSAVRGLIFYPGALVDPRAYAPYARAVAAAGYPAFIVELPRRGAFGGADDPVLLERTMSVMRGHPAIREWIIAGHSKGVVVSSTMASRRLPHVAGLVLIGSTHPRDVDLSALTIPVTKIVGSRDGVAKLDDALANRHLLPVHTNWIELRGANHSQFGGYGFQPGDKFSEMSREEQQRATTGALLCMMTQACEGPDRAGTRG